MDSKKAQICDDLRQSSLKMINECKGELSGWVSVENRLVSAMGDQNGSVLALGEETEASLEEISSLAVKIQRLEKMKVYIESWVKLESSVATVEDAVAVIKQVRHTKKTS